MVIIIMGVAGAGKTTVGRALAESLGWRFQDADDLHSAESVDKMRRGVPLDDADRGPWLARLRQIIEDAAATGTHVLIACSALRERYRRLLAGGVPDVRFVLLHATPALLRERLAGRVHHFARVELLESQLAALEPSPDALTLDAEAPVERLVQEIRDAFGLR